MSVTSNGDAIEPQQIELAFAQKPTPERLAEVQRALNETLDAALR